MMKTLFSAAFALVVILTYQSAAAQHAAPGGNKSLVWRVSGKGLAKASYLFGSMDYVCPGDYLWTTTMQDCYAKCDNVCLTMNPDDANLKKEMREALTDQHKHLKDYFTPAEYAMVKQYAKDSMHIDLDKPALQSLKPIAIQPFIAMHLLGCGKPVAYELRICEKAKKDDKAVLDIEKVSEFMHTIDATHFNDKVAAILVEIAKGSAYYHVYRHNIEVAYQQQDIVGINAMFKATKGCSKADLRVLLDERNKLWLNRMPAMMRHGSTFFTVNPTNMWGDEGLISQLRKLGYTAEPVY